MPGTVAAPRHCRDKGRRRLTLAGPPTLSTVIDGCRTPGLRTCIHDGTCIFDRLGGSLAWRGNRARCRCTSKARSDASQEPVRGRRLPDKTGHQRRASADEGCWQAPPRRGRVTAGGWSLSLRLPAAGRLGVRVNSIVASNPR